MYCQISNSVQLDNGNTPYYGEAVVTTSIPFLSNNDTNLTLATLNPRPMEVRWMEYHNKHTQTFIPMEGKPFVAVLGAQIGARLIGKVKGEHLRLMLAIMVLLVGTRLALDLILTPSDIFSAEELASP